MAPRLNFVEPSECQWQASAEALQNALREQPPADRAEAGLRIAADWMKGESGEIDVVDERRLELAYSRVLAREASDAPDRMDLSSIDFGRALLVDVSLQREAEIAVQLDVLDRRDHCSWLNAALQEAPCMWAEVSPTEFLHFNDEELTAIAAGRFDELCSYQREGVEVMLLRGMSRRDDGFDQALHKLNANIFAVGDNVDDFADVAKAEKALRAEEAQRFGTRSGPAGLSSMEIEGVAERLTVARHADLYREQSNSLYDPRPGRNPFVLREGAGEKGEAAVDAAMNGHKRSRMEKTIRVALEFQMERGVVLDRPAFQRMERAAGRLLTMPNVNELSDLDAAKVLIVDSAIQKTAKEALSPVRLVVVDKGHSSSQQILGDMLGRGSVPIFTTLKSERNDTQAVAAGRFHDLTDDRGIGSMVRQALYRSGQDVSGETGEELERLHKSIRIGSTQNVGWIDVKAQAGSKAVGASRLHGLSHGPAAPAPQQVAKGRER